MVGNSVDVPVGEEVEVVVKMAPAVSVAVSVELGLDVVPLEGRVLTYIAYDDVEHPKL